MRLFTATFILLHGKTKKKDLAIFMPGMSMREPIHIKQFKPYVWMGIIFLFLSLLSDLSSHPDNLGYRFLNHLWKLSYATTLHYLLLEYIFAGIRKRSIASSLLLLAVQIFLYSMGLYVWRLLGVGLHVYTALVTFKSRGLAVADQMAYSMMSLLFFVLASHVYHHVRLRQTAQQLRIEKQQAELNYLKSQTNPHFLFNTLNNIYSLARVKSDLAPESVLRLSKILRFMLYESSGHQIAAEQELTVIGDYIQLEKLRYDESFPIHFSHDVDDVQQPIPPLLLMPLVENAFKHGASETRKQPFVNIRLTIKNRQLVFTVKNSHECADEQLPKENIGLSNLRRQLELLFRDYSLEVQQEKMTFTAILKINLASHV